MVSSAKQPISQSIDRTLEQIVVSDQYPYPFVLYKTFRYLSNHPQHLPKIAFVVPSRQTRLWLGGNETNVE